MATQIPEDLPPQTAIDEIWDGDLFDRKTEATQLIAFIESVVGRPVLREDKSAYTIAIDAKYGEGKTYFLKRLKEQLSLNHPVAYIDAWADDLADEPLTALAATLEEALQPFFEENKVQKSVADFMAKTGRVVKIASGGLLRRGLGLLLTGVAADELLDGVTEEVEEAVKEAGEKAIDDTVEELQKTPPGKLMQERVDEFKEGKAAIQAMKNSLRAVVEALDGIDHHPPIVIVIDELDRCRPTYAIKLLEEIKHLFDVPGLVFVFGTYGEQLRHSVSGAYGAGFDGRSYLRRFIDREYRLKAPEMRTLVAYLCDQQGVTNTKFVAPDAKVTDTGRILETSEVIADYMTVFGLTARDSFQLIDMMQIASSMADPNQSIFLPYFLPLAIGQMLGEDEGDFPRSSKKFGWEYVTFDGWESNPEKLEPLELAQSVKDATRLTRREVFRASADDGASFALRVVAENYPNSGHRFRPGTPNTLPELLRAVGRFSDPRVDGSPTG
tara:strand:+ start:266 stop:1759 length:1494 start_codon:yes stop_codon:yes gene_type:complete